MIAVVTRPTKINIIYCMELNEIQLIVSMLNAVFQKCSYSVNDFHIYVALFSFYACNYLFRRRIQSAFREEKNVQLTSSVADCSYILKHWAASVSGCSFLSLTFHILPTLEGSLFLLLGLTISTLCKISKFLRRQTRHCLNSGVSYRLVALQPDTSLGFVCRALAGSIQTATLFPSCCPVLQPSRQDQTETAA